MWECEETLETTTINVLFLAVDDPANLENEGLEVPGTPPVWMAACDAAILLVGLGLVGGFVLRRKRSGCEAAKYAAYSLIR